MIFLVDQQDIRLDDLTSLALEIYNSSFFESSTRAQFLCLIQMLEILSTRQVRSSKSLGHVLELKKLTEAAIDRARNEQRNTDLDSLNRMMSTLGDLKYESISQAIQHLVNDSLISDKDSKITTPDFVKRCYKTRSELAHDGRTNMSETEFAALLHSLRGVCMQVLRKTIGYRSIENPEGVKGPMRLLGAMAFAEVAPSEARF
jgi:hypothetical protein